MIGPVGGITSNIEKSIKKQKSNSVEINHWPRHEIITFGKLKIYIIKKGLHSKQSMIIPKSRLHEITLKRKGFVNYLVINGKVIIKWWTLTKHVFFYHKMKQLINNMD